MNRLSFLKKLGIGIVAIVVAPGILTPKRRRFMAGCDPVMPKSFTSFDITEPSSFKILKKRDKLSSEEYHKRWAEEAYRLSKFYDKNPYSNFEVNYFKGISNVPLI